jgi:hypothetical protein
VGCQSTNGCRLARSIGRLDHTGPTTNPTTAGSGHAADRRSKVAQCGYAWEAATDTHPARRTYVRVFGSWASAVAATEAAASGRHEPEPGPGVGLAGGPQSR